MSSQVGGVGSRYISIVFALQKYFACGQTAGSSREGVTLDIRVPL